MNQLKLFLIYVMTYTPKFDNNEAQRLARGIITPMTTFALWATPLVAGLAAALTAVQFFSKDEEEREQKPLGRSLSKILKGAVLAMSVPAILKIFGL